MWTDIKEFTHSVLEDSDAIAFFKSEDDARNFAEWKSDQPNPNECDYDIGQYIDLDVNVNVRGS